MSEEEEEEIDNRAINAAIFNSTVKNSRANEEEESSFSSPANDFPQEVSEQENTFIICCDTHPWTRERNTKNLQEKSRLVNQ